MADETTPSPRKFPVTVRWIVLLIFGGIAAHFVANYDRYLPRRWETYSAPDGSFSIQLPGKLTVEPTKIPIESGGTMMATMISAAPTDHTTYMVTCIDNPNIGQKSPDQALSSTRDGALRNIQGTALTEKKINVQGFSGLDVQSRARGNSLVDMRLVVAGNRLFMIMAVATVEEDREPKTILHMFDSFKLNQK